MTFVPTVVAVGVVDRERIAGTSGIRVTWGELGAAAPGTGRTFRAVFGRADETFRRLDHTSRVLVLAAEAAGIGRALPADRRDDTALVVETTLGSLDADLRFAASMRTGMCDGPVFPYTLPSTCLGEVALRHGLRGASVCLSVAPEARGAALAEALRMLAAGEASTAVVGSVDFLGGGQLAGDAACTAVVALIAGPHLGLDGAVEWPGTGPRAFHDLRDRVTAGRG